MAQAVVASVAEVEGLQTGTDASITAPRTRPHHAKTTPQGVRWHSSNIASILVSETASPQKGDTCSRYQASYSGHHGDQDTTSQASKTSGSASHTPITIALENLPRPVRGALIDSRYFSQSNWAYSATLVPEVVSWYDKIYEDKAECWQTMQRCSSLAKQLLQRQSIDWTSKDYGTFLPPKDVADPLIDAYLRTFEKIYRILHVPSFMNQYAAIWENPRKAATDYLVQVQLCLALGVCVSDDTCSWRPNTLQWIAEAAAWVEPEKATVSICSIQTMCLLALARKSTQDVYGCSLWIRSGALLRTAMSIGLHRDPQYLPGIPPAQAQIRRRLWTTVLELVLDSSLDAGALPLISSDHHDCALPMNLNDAELNFDIEAELVPHDDSETTDTSLQIALARTFSARLAIANINDFKLDTSYPEILKLTTDFQHTWDTLKTAMRRLSHGLTEFQHNFCQMIFSRYIYTLHIPFYNLALKNPIYAFSRHACVDAALKLSYAAVHPAIMHDSIIQSLQQAAKEPDGRISDYARLMLHGFGAFRAVQFQTFMIIAAELKTSLSGRTTTCSDPISSIQNIRDHELTEFVRMAVEWSKYRLITGIENTKDVVFLAALFAYVDAVAKGGVPSDAMDSEGQKACTEAHQRWSQEIRVSESITEDEFPITEQPWDCGTQEFWTADLHSYNEFMNQAFALP